jgi:hypothetical protein
MTGYSSDYFQRATEFYPVHGDRKPWLIPLAEGWEWHLYSDGKRSTRWVTDGTAFRCTCCGHETKSQRGLAGHNRVHTPQPEAATA